MHSVNPPIVVSTRYIDLGVEAAHTSSALQPSLLPGGQPSCCKKRCHYVLAVQAELHRWKSLKWSDLATTGEKVTNATEKRFSAVTTGFSLASMCGCARVRRIQEVSQW
jgi:hypothetical protein